MTVATEASTISYTANGATLSFPVPFPFQASSQLVVTLEEPGGVETTQTTGFSVTGAGGASGAVVFDTEPVDTTVVRISRTVAFLQEEDLTAQGSFSAARHEDAIDYLTYLCQQLDRRLEDVEALGDLVPTTSYGGSLVSLQFTTEASVEDTFPLDLALGVVPTGIAVVRAQNLTDPSVAFEEAVTAADWSPGGSGATLNYITGLDASTEYLLTFEVLSDA